MHGVVIRPTISVGLVFPAGFIFRTEKLLREFIELKLAIVWAVSILSQRCAIL